MTGGKLVYIAGQVALDKSGAFTAKTIFSLRSNRCLRTQKPRSKLRAGISTMSLSFYCYESVDPALIPQVRGIRDKYGNTQNPPASTFVVVHRLVRPEWLIEVEATAVVKQ